MQDDDTLMDIEELIELLETLPKNCRVTMAVGDEVVPVSRLASFGLYNTETQEFKVDLSSAMSKREEQVFAICFTPEEEEE
jgi:hypothetical protein